MSQSRPEIRPRLSRPEIRILDIAVLAALRGWEAADRPMIAAEVDRLAPVIPLTSPVAGMARELRHLAVAWAQGKDIWRPEFDLGREVRTYFRGRYAAG